MRRVFLAGLGSLEALVAAALLVIASQLPTQQDVSANFARVAKVTDGSERQVRLMKDEVADLRTHDFPRRAEQLRLHARTAADGASKQQVDFKTVDAIGRSLGDVARGLNAWADTVDVERMQKVSTGLGETAGYLEQNVAEPSEKSAAELEVVLAGLEKDSTRLAALLRLSAPDLKAAKAIHDGLGNFDAGLDKLGELIKADRMDAMKEGLTGLETSLTTTAEQVDKVSRLSYPIITVNGLKPNIETKPFWPDGEKVSDGLKKATKGVQAANKEMEVMGKTLPDLRKALEESRKSVTQTRESLGGALKQQAEMEKLMKTVPEQTALLAETLPKLGKTLAQMLRETKKLRELALGLRGVRKSLDDTLKTWPEVAGGLKKSAGVLDGARLQLEQAAENRGEYERAMASSSEIARSMADLLPAFTDQLDSRLGQQEASLDQMQTGLSEVNSSLPAVEEKTGQLVWMVKCLLYLVAALIGLHAAYVLADGVYGARRLPTLQVG